MSRRRAHRKLARKASFTNWLRQTFEPSLDPAGAPRRLQFETLDSRLLLSSTQFQVNTFTTGDQKNPKIASDTNGDFVVVWQSNNQDGDDYGIFAQRYNSLGAAQGGEFQVNTFTTGRQENPTVAMDSAGDFVIAWDSYGQDSSTSYGIYAQRYNSSGTKQGTAFLVNTFTTGNQIAPSAAMDSAGDFVISWESYGQDNNSAYGIYAQRYNSSGVKQGTELHVNTFTTGNQINPAAAMDSAGDFVIAWESYGQDGDSYGIYFQRYNSSGVAQGTTLAVNTFTTGDQTNAAVAMDSAGDFVIAWQSDGQAANYGIYAQRYASGGTAQGSNFLVSTATTKQVTPSVSMDSTGDFVVAWAGYGQEGGQDYGVYAQRYTSAGTVQAAQIHVNDYTTGNQQLPGVAMDATGDFVAAWESYGEDGDGYGIYAKQYAEHYTVTETGASGAETLIITKPDQLTSDLTLSSDASGNLTISDPNNFFKGGPFTGVTVTANSVTVTHATAGVVHLVFDVSSNDGQSNLVTIGNLNGATIPGFDVLSEAGSIDVVEFSTSTIDTGSSIAANASINLTNVAQALFTSSTTIKTAQLTSNHPGSVNFGGAELSAITTGVNLTIDTSTSTSGISGGGVTIEGLNTNVGDEINNLAITTTGGASATAGTISLENDLDTVGSQLYSGPVSLLGSAIFDSTGTNKSPINFLSTVDGAFSLAVDSDGVIGFAGAVGSSVPLASLTSQGNSLAGVGVTAVGANVTTTGDQDYNNQLVVNSNPTLTSTGGNLNFNSSVGGNSSLDTNSPNLTAFNGLVSIASLTTGGGSTGLTEINSASGISTVGTQSYNEPLLVANNPVLASSGGNLLFNASVGGNSALTTVSPGATVFNALVSIASLTADGLSGGGFAEINTGTVNTIGTQTYALPVLLANNPVLISSQGSLVFGSTVGGNSNLTASSSVSTIFGGLVSIVSLNIGGPGYIVVGGGSVTTTSDQTYMAPVVLGANSTFASNSGNLLFESTIGGNASLLTFSPLYTVFGGLVSIGSLATGSIGLTAISGGPLTTLGNQVYNSPVLLASNPVLTSNQGSITFESTVGGDSSLTTNSVGTTTFDKLVSILSLVVNTTGASVVLNGGNVITQLNQTYNAPVVLTMNTTITSTGNGNLTFNALVSANPPPITLTLNTLGTRKFAGGLGAGVILVRGA